MLEIIEHRPETASVRTIRLDASIEAVPGQFVMIWVPGIDEFPMSLSYIGEKAGITFQIVGEGTRALGAVNAGARIGLRGPYGHGFELSGKKILVVAGGLGIAPTAPMIEGAVGAGAEVHLVLGAKNSSELVFEDRCQEAGAKVHISTDDGSKGAKGFATDLAKGFLENESYDLVCTCGPERMIASLLHMCTEKDIPVQASIERLMKCGIGICDSCAIDGLHVCTDGPVFSSQALSRMSQLGKSKHDLCGREVSI